MVLSKQSSNYQIHSAITGTIRKLSWLYFKQERRVLWGMNVGSALLMQHNIRQDQRLGQEAHEQQQREQEQARSLGSGVHKDAGNEHPRGNTDRSSA